MERYISLHRTDGSSVKAARIKSNDSDALLRAKLFFTLPHNERQNIDLSDADFTGKQLDGIEGCSFRNSNLTGAVITNAYGCDFSQANLTGATFIGNCHDMYLKDANLTGLQISAGGIFVGGYFVDGTPVVANKRSDAWWLNVSVEGRNLYFPYLETSAVIYGQSLSDDIVHNLVQIISRVRARIVNESRDSEPAAKANPAQELSQGLKRNRDAVSHVQRVDANNQEFVTT